MAFDINKIPQLPHGEGTINVYNDKLLIYKKAIKTSDGRSHRVSVYGETPQVCMRKMRTKELELERKIANVRIQTLEDAMNDWCDHVHQQTVKQQTYDRLKKTIRNQIAKYSIGQIQYSFPVIIIHTGYTALVYVVKKIIALISYSRMIEKPYKSIVNYRVQQFLRKVLAHIVAYGGFTFAKSHMRS